MTYRVAQGRRAQRQRVSAEREGLRMTGRQRSHVTHRAWSAQSNRGNGSNAETIGATLAAATHDQLVGESFAARLAQLDDGDELLARRAATSVVLVGVAGCLHVVAGTESFRLWPRDVLTIPQGMTYSARNAVAASTVVAEVSSLEDDPEATVQLGTAHLLSWDTYRREFRSAILPRAEVYGHHRLSGPHTPLRTLLGHAVRVPPNQASPWHQVPRDLLFIQLTGEIDFSSAGVITLLRPADLLLVRAGTPYSYANHGFTDAVFFDIGGRILTPGATSTYYEEDPGWPVREEVDTYKIVSDDPAFKAIYGS
jgi:mannose-6-phosphate isomerase-like protein (cupin superfamily)